MSKKKEESKTKVPKMSAEECMALNKKQALEVAQKDTEEAKKKLGM